MANDAEDVSVPGEMATTSERIGFAADELIACPKCSKTNPPNRLQCFYCGAELDLPGEVRARIQLRPESPEQWERGYNVVFLGSDEKIGVEDILAAVRIEGDLVEGVLGMKPPMPLVRVRDAGEAEAIAARLRAIGIDAAAAADVDLHAETPPTRVRSVEFRENAIALEMFNSNEWVEARREDVKLIVSGAIVERLSEGTVKKKRGGTTLENEASSMNDFGVLDIYVDGDLNGYRITTRGFDFSCLGSDKSFVAGANLEKLKDKLTTFCPHAELDVGYRKKASVLDLVWPPEVSNRSKGQQRVGFKLELSKGEMTTNAEQFTKYSRLRAMFL